jgi:hypothetical protein
MVASQRAVERHVGAVFVKLGLSLCDADSRRVRAVLTYLITLESGHR